MSKTETLLDIFERDPVRLVATAWGIDARSLYRCNLGRISKSDASDEKITQGENFREKIEEMTGLMPHEQHGQAAVIRRVIKKAVCDRCWWKPGLCHCAPALNYNILDARLTIPHDDQSRQQKDGALSYLLDVNFDAYGVHEDHPTGLHKEWIRILLHTWANDMVHIAMKHGYDPRAGIRLDRFLLEKMRSFDSHSDRQERRHRNRMYKLMNESFDEVLNLIDRRM